MRKKPVETIMGIVVLLVAVLFLAFAYRVSDLQVVKGYTVSADTMLPKDSTVMIVSDGLMGDKFVKIEPGKAKEYMQDGDKFAKTKDFKSLEDMVGEIIFMVTDGGDKHE